MHIEAFQPSFEGEARLLVLIEAFSRGKSSLEGRVKLAKLDFFLRYPNYFRHALILRGATEERLPPPIKVENIDTKMVRYRYGPWDPSYYAVLGRLIGRGLVLPVPFSRGIGYRVTPEGRETAKALRKEPAWEEIAYRVDLLKKHMNLAGTTLKNFIYNNFPEITQASWGEKL